MHGLGVGNCPGIPVNYAMYSSWINTWIYSINKPTYIGSVNRTTCRLLRSCVSVYSIMHMFGLPLLIALIHGSAIDQLMDSEIKKQFAHSHTISVLRRWLSGLVFMRMNKTKSFYSSDRKCSVIRERILRHKRYAKYKKDSPVSVCATKKWLLSGNSIIWFR